MRLAAAIALAIAGCAAHPPCLETYVPTAPVRPFLWEVTGPHGSAVLLGTFHPAGEEDIPAAGLPLLEHADVFVAEAAEPPRRHPMSRVEQTYVYQYLVAEPSQRLSRWLTEDELGALSHHTGADTAYLVQLKPWVVINLLFLAAFDMPDPNIARALFDLADTYDIAKEFFDGWDQQVDFLDRTVGADDVRGALAEFDHLRCNTINQVAAYRAGDNSAFVVRDLPLGDPGPERVERWTARIAGYLATGRRAFVAIGVGNILGPEGIAARLEAMGFLITRYER